MNTEVTEYRLINEEDEELEENMKNFYLDNY